MGLFGKRNIKVIKENHNGKVEYLLDCAKLKEPMDLARKVFQVFTKEDCSWFIIDTNYTYERNQKIIAANLKKIFSFLDEKGIPYISTEKMIEKNISLMGIPMKKQKVKEFKVGIKVTEEVLSNLEIIFENISAFCYRTKENKEFQEILDLHNRINVDGNEYRTLIGKDGFQMFIYLDNYFKRIRLATEDNLDSSLIQKIIEANYE